VVLDTNYGTVDVKKLGAENTRTGIMNNIYASLAPRPPPSKASSSSGLLPNKTDEYKGEDPCSICFNGPKDSLLFPCGHIAMCFSCANILKERKEPCSICRTPIEKVIRAFKA